MNDAVTLYRCSTCGKWSTAKTKPRQHLRWVGDGTSPEHGDYVTCGPFDTYEARKV